VAYLIDALHQLQIDGIKFNATIVGNGSLHNVLSKQIERLGLSDSVSLIGSLPLNEVKDILGRSKLFILPSIDLPDDVEGLPTIILDAMSQMAVVIATNAGGVTDVVKNNVNGILVAQKQPAELAKAINKLLSDEALRNNYAERAYELVKADYTYDVIAKKLIGIIEGDFHTRVSRELIS
jgi:glycosyltransferase involved in cell wall biosynthesis